MVVHAEQGGLLNVTPQARTCGSPCIAAAWRRRACVRVLWSGAVNKDLQARLCCCLGAYVLFPWQHTSALVSVRAAVQWLAPQGLVLAFRAIGKPVTLEMLLEASQFLEGMCRLFLCSALSTVRGRVSKGAVVSA